MEQNLLCYLHLFFPWHLITCFISPLFFLGASSYLEEYNSHNVTTLVSAWVRLIWRINVNCVHCICIRLILHRAVPLLRCDILNYPFLSESSSNIRTFQACRMAIFCTTPFLLSFSDWFTTVPLNWMSLWSFRIIWIEGKALCILVKVREMAGGETHAEGNDPKFLSTHLQSLLRDGSHGSPWHAG